eukprot:scaffold585696_cov48-Prasinocladus_malaysianus.AAC.1
MLKARSEAKLEQACRLHHGNSPLVTRNQTRMTVYAIIKINQFLNAKLQDLTRSSHAEVKPLVSGKLEPK